MFDNNCKYAENIAREIKESEFCKRTRRMTENGDSL